MVRQAADLSLAGLAGYFVGTFPSADVASTIATRGAADLRSSGSGNPGAVNAMQVLGKRWGYAVMAADIGKGALAAGVGRRIAATNGAHLCATAAVIGHCFPVWSGFRGGKGVAASVGQCLATFPAYFPIDLAVAAVTASSPRWKQRAFASTAAASITWVGASVLWWQRGWPNAWGPPATAALPLGATVSSAVILFKFANAVTPAAPTPAPTSPDHGSSDKVPT